MPDKPVDAIEFLGLSAALDLLRELDPARDWTIGKLKDRIDRTKEVRPQKVGQALVFTRRQIERWQRGGYREWPEPFEYERVYSRFDAARLLSEWTGRRVTPGTVKYQVVAKRRLRPVRIGRMDVYSHAELRRYLKAERARAYQRERRGAAKATERGDEPAL